MKRAAITIALIVATPFTWIAGEQHRENCVRHGNVSCSMLPWDNGSTPKADPDGGWRLAPNGLAPGERLVP